MHFTLVIPRRRRRDIDLPLFVRPPQTCWVCISKIISDLNFRSVQISLRRSVLHKYHNPSLPNFRVNALCYFSFILWWGTYLSDNKRFQHETIGRWTLMSGSVLRKNHNLPLLNFTVIALCFSILSFCVEHTSVTTKDISMNL